jgi:hypothetical protein
LKKSDLRSQLGVETLCPYFVTSFFYIKKFQFEIECVDVNFIVIKICFLCVLSFADEGNVVSVESFVEVKQ